jgi:glycosyltransferase involved in cell wall biosynthesis
MTLVRPWAIVPAHNEAPRIGAVLETLLRCKCLAGVLVVDDGSTDDTAAKAREAGAEVLTLSPNRGKAQAMRAGVQKVDELVRGAGAGPPAAYVAFFDADLRGLTPEHVQLLVDHAAAGWDMVCGLRDHNWFASLVQLVMPLVTGERVVARWVLDAVHESCWDGYCIELAMNDACTRGGGRIVAVPLKGLRIFGKTEKVGLLGGLGGHARMFGQLDQVDVLLDCGGTCDATGAVGAVA